MRHEDEEPPKSPGHDQHETGPYQVFMLALCILALGVLAVESSRRLDSSTREILHTFDLIVCGLFFLDFLNNLMRARDRFRYFVTWGWIDLLSSIPAIDALRWGRMARIFRILRALRAFKASRILAEFALRQRSQSTFLAVSLLSLILVVAASIAILQVESFPDANIREASDAIWWALVTITTVGYGDHYPVTEAGRFFAVLLMLAGVGLFGTFTGFIASWFAESNDRVMEQVIRDLRDEIHTLRLAVEKLSVPPAPQDPKNPPGPANLKE